MECPKKQASKEVYEYLSPPPGKKQSVSPFLKPTMLKVPKV